MPTALPVLRTAADHSALYQAVLAGLADGRAQALANSGIISFLGVNPATGLAEIEVRAIHALQLNADYERAIQGAQIDSVVESREQGQQIDLVEESQVGSPVTETTTQQTDPTQTVQQDSGVDEQEINEAAVTGYYPNPKVWDEIADDLFETSVVGTRIRPPDPVYVSTGFRSW